MVRTCSSHGWWTHPQGRFIRTIDNRSKKKSDATLCDSWTLANVTSKYAKLIQTTGKMPRAIVPAGDGQWKKESRKQTWNVTRKLKRSRACLKHSSTLPSSNFICVVLGLPLAHWPTQPHKTLQHHHGLTRVHNLCPSRLSPANYIIQQIPLQTRLESVFNDIFSTSTF